MSGGSLTYLAPNIDTVENTDPVDETLIKLCRARRFIRVYSSKYNTVRVPYSARSLVQYSTVDNVTVDLGFLV